MPIYQTLSYVMVLCKVKNDFKSGRTKAITHETLSVFYSTLLSQKI